MAERKPISKKLRFEVFKRDSFTCQYCGRHSPDVVLEVDHLTPVAEGGKNTIMNLITSCFDCNRGKGKRKLSDNAETEKQFDRMAELNEKREQMKMMLEWREELKRFEDEQIDAIEKEICQEGRELTEIGRRKIAFLIKEYGFDEVLESATISKYKYYIQQRRTFDVMFNKIGGICYNRKHGIRGKSDEYKKDR